MPNPTHEYISYSTPLSSPNTIAERRPLFIESRLLSPQTPGLYSSFSGDTLREEYSGGSAFETKGLSRDIVSSPTAVEGYQEPERYRLVGNQRPISFARMDMEVQRMKDKDSKLKRNIRRFRFVVRSAHLACSIVVISLLAANFAVFFRTQDHLIRDDGQLESAWGGTKAWPAMFLLVVAAVSAVLSIVMLLSYMHSVKWANRFATMDASFMIGASVVFLLIWAISAGLFHNREAPAFNVPNIWSWACNHKLSSDNTVNFNQICVTQEWSFICAIIEVGLELLTIGSVLLIFVRRKSKTQVRKTERYSTFVQENHGQPGMTGEYDEPSTPNRAFARLDGQEKGEYEARKGME